MVRILGRQLRIHGRPLEKLVVAAQRTVNRWTQFQCVERLEKQQPGHSIQIDVKFIEPLKGARKSRYYQFTAIDDCTRLRVLRIYDKNNQATAIQFLDYVCQKLPFRVDTIQTDNGSEFASQFHWHVLDRGIRHAYIKPATPRLNGRGSPAAPRTSERRVRDRRVAASLILRRVGHMRIRFGYEKAEHH